MPRSTQTYISMSKVPILYRKYTSEIIFSFYCLLSIFASSLSVVNQVIFVHKSTLGCTMSYMAGYLDTLELFVVLYSCSWKRNVNSHEVYILFVFPCVSWCKLFSEPHYFSLRVLLVLYLLATRQWSVHNVHNGVKRWIVLLHPSVSALYWSCGVYRLNFLLCRQAPSCSLLTSFHRSNLGFL